MMSNDWVDFTKQNQKTKKKTKKKNKRYHKRNSKFHELTGVKMTISGGHKYF